MAGQYRFKDQSGNIVAQISASVEGAIAFSGSVVDFTQANNIILGNVQLAGTASNALLLDGFDSQAFAFTSSIHPFTASIAGTNTFTSSATARLNSIETISASNVSRLNELEAKTGSLATTGSNTFIGTQTITGSLYISSDLIVQGSSSLQNITASAVSIGTNLINLNTANPAIRYAGLVIGDSGSVGGSGSFLYDSVQDEMIFVHRGASTTVTSSVVLMGPQTFDTIGTETYPTANRIQKGTGNEHLVDSCIIDNGNTICFNVPTGSFSGRLDVGGNLNVGNTNTSSSITLTGAPVGGFTAGYVHFGKGNQTTSGLHIESPGTNLEITTGFNERIALSTGTGLQVYTNNGGGIYTSRMLLDRSGNTCFSGTICSVGVNTSESLVIRKDASTDNRYIQLCNTQTGGYRWDLVTRSTAQGCGFGILNNTTSQYALLIDANNISSFGGTICGPGISSTSNVNSGITPIRISNPNPGSSAFSEMAFFNDTVSQAGLFYNSSNRSADAGVCSFSIYNDSANGNIRLRSGGCIVLATGAPATDRLSINPSGVVSITGEGIFINRPAASSGEPYIFWQKDGVTRGAIYGAANASGLRYFGASNCFEGVICSGGSIVRKGFDSHTNGQWYKIPFYLNKGNGVGLTDTKCIVIINNNDSFQELHFTIEYGARLQGFSDSYTQTSLRTYSVNRFVGNTATINDVYLITGGSGCSINNHAPMSVAIVGSCMSVVKVDFSSTLGGSSFVWGEVRIFSIESLAGKITIANNEY
jgi:hypothetical protein